MRYVIREVDGGDDDVASEIAVLHDLTFGATAPRVDTSAGHWWLAYPDGVFDPEPVAFAGVVPSERYLGVGYFVRVGVIEGHRGQGLQIRLMRTVEARSRRNGWSHVVSDTTDNVPSANNFIRAGYKLFEPADPWAFGHSLYWSKCLHPNRDKANG